MQTLELIKKKAGSNSTNFSDEEIQAMLRVVPNLFEKWGLSDNEASILLGGISPRTFKRWKSKENTRPNVDLAARISNILGIHKALRILFKDADRGYNWIKRSNSDFNSKSALEIMLGGQMTDLMRVRRYLDNQRGAW